MSPREYEEYVAELVQQLDFGSTFSVTRNARVAGVRQPGEYEIDVAVKVKLANRIDFFLIVECKNWTRPVDRPVVQKLAQTRDAVAAHKAAIVSPVGFSQEAIAVAQANGIALWVISRTEWHTIMGIIGPSWSAWRKLRERVNFVKRVFTPGRIQYWLRHLGWVRLDLFNYRTDELALIKVGHTRATGATAWNELFSHISWCGSAVTNGDNVPGIDPRLAISELTDNCAKLLRVEIISWETEAIDLEYHDGGSGDE